MITVEEAEKLIFQHTLTLKSEAIPYQQANGRILNEEIFADRDFPPFNRVTMDGIAIQYSQDKEYNIIGIQAAGSPPQKLSKQSEAIEVMTGAVLPEGADTVIPYELINIDGSTPRKAILESTPKKGQNVHRKGSDRLKGALIVRPGTIIGATEIGIAATVGLTEINVLKPPKVAIISTGDELVPVDHTPLPHQIRSSNAATLASALEKWSISSDLFHIVDDLEGTTNKLEELLESYEVLILSGGVSKGKFDYVPSALDKLQVKKHFHRIKQRPGKPFWFGSHKSGAVVFAFPGNPVSVFMCFIRYLQPWLNQVFNLTEKAVKAQLDQDISFTPDLTYLAQVKIDIIEGAIVATPIQGHGSGDLANLVDADGFIELPRGKDIFRKGELYTLYPYRTLNTR